MFNDPKTKAIMMGGGIAALISVFPGLSLINFICCAGFILGGYLSVYFYHKTKIGYLTLAEGALMGLMSGVAAALIALFIQMIFVQAIGLEGLSQSMNETFEQFGLGSDAMKDLDGFNPAMMFTFPLILVYALGSALLYGFFGMIGGMIRAAQDTDHARTPKGPVEPPYSI
ncbi:MAG: hypothetical protein J0L62_15135 [Bacteroidetes bacterium]|nr:hypothetical protein [Bacteroidota bacterium]